MNLSFIDYGAKARFERIMYALSGVRCTSVVVQHIEGFILKSRTEIMQRNRVVIKMWVSDIDSAIVLNGIWGDLETTLVSRQRADFYVECMVYGMSRLEDKVSLQIAADWFENDGDETHVLRSLQEPDSHIEARLDKTQWIRKDPPIWEFLSKSRRILKDQFDALIKTNMKFKLI